MKRIFRRLTTLPILGTLNEFLMTAIWLAKISTSNTLKSPQEKLSWVNESKNDNLPTIIFVCRNYLMPGFSGVNNWVENIARAVQQDFEIKIYVQSDYLFQNQEERVGNVTIVKIAIGKHLRLRKLPLYSAWNRSVKEQLKKIPGPINVIAPLSGVESYTLDHIPGINLHTLLVTDERTHRFPGKSKIELQDMASLDSRTQEVVRRERNILSSTKGTLIGDSSAIIRDLEELFDCKLLTRSVVLPINLEIDSCAQKVKQKIIFFVGRADRRKGLGILLDAWEEVFFLLPDWKLVIATSGGDDYETSRRLNGWGTSNFNATVFWNIDEHGKHNFMAESAIVVVPSLYESFGIVALEALQHGCVSIISNVGGLPEVVENLGVMFNPFSSRDLAQKIVSTARNEKILKAFPELGKIRVREQFSDNAIRDRVVQILLAEDSS